MPSDMRPLNSKKGEETPSRGLENCGVSNQACHGKCQSCDGDGKQSRAGANGVSSLSESLAEEMVLKENCGTCDFNSDHADALLVDRAKGSLARSGHADNADCDGCLHGKNESCMAYDDLRQESDREQAGDTLEDLFFFNDEEEDDSDWEPSARLVVNRWFCLNCTVPNMDEVTHCMGSEVAGYAVFKTHIAQTALVSSDTALPPVSTAIGFDERMLLHSEIEIKPNPHPERPDRLRAIAASLTAAGDRCR